MISQHPLLRELFQHSSDAIIVTDAFGEMTSATPLASAILQRSFLDEALKPENLDKIVEFEHEGALHIAYWLRKPEGESLALDHLTGLPNRVMVESVGGKLLERAKENDEKVYVCFLDLDGFKGVNDRHGHALGDATLRAAADRINLAFRRRDLVGRIGGDEFLIAIPGATRDEVVAHCRKAIENIEGIKEVEGTAVRVSATVGVSCFPDDGKSFDELMSMADHAMYEQKKSGAKGEVRFFNRRIKSSLEDRRQLEEELEVALTEGQFANYYQFQVDMRTQKPIGVESLVRWVSPSRGVVSPGVFLPLLTAKNRMRDLEMMILATAVHDTSTMEPLLPEHFSVAVNVSPELFSSRGFPETLASLLSRNNVPPHRVKVEIIESQILEDTERTSENFRLLKEMGTPLALDDFGTGYSSIAQMHRYDFDQIKLDKAFVDNILTDPRQKRIVDSIIHIVGNLDMDVLAEGVEDKEQALALARSGCYKIQGYFFARPVPFHDIMESLRRLKLR